MDFHQPQHDPQDLNLLRHFRRLAPPQMNAPEPAAIPTDGAHPHPATIDQLTTSGPKQSRKPAVEPSPAASSAPRRMDARQLLNPKAAAASQSKVADSTNTPSGINRQDSTDDDGKGRSLGNMLERMNNVIPRAEATPITKKRKADGTEDDNLDGDSKKPKNATFNASGGGTVSSHITEQRQNIADQLGPTASSAPIDLTEDDDDVILTGIIPRNNDEEVCLGVLHASINAHRVPYVSPGAQRGFLKDLWPPTKVLLGKRAAGVKGNTVYPVVDRQGQRFGHLSADIALALGPLLEGHSVNKLRLIIMLKERPRKLGEHLGQSISQSFKADLTVFTPRSRVLPVGRWLSQRGFWFSQPVINSGKEYVNPSGPVSHKPSEAALKAKYQTPSAAFVSRTAEEMTREANDMFDVLAKATDLQEHDPTSEIINTPLLPHQKQALSFLMKQEDCEDAVNQAGTETSLWKFRAKDNGKRAWYHIITGQEVYEKPEPFLGGILADMMGLGKTLSILSLIAELQYDAARFRQDKPPVDLIDVDCNARGTLIIVPKSVLSNWEEQIKTHIKRGKLRYYAYHGSSRTQLTHQLGKFDIVLTTYNTVASEFTESRAQKKRALAAINWFRIVLDEAHTIRNQSSRTFKACCALHAQRRWAVTGTPVQNSLNDFGALLRFLRIRPFVDPNVWVQYIMAKFKSADTLVIQQLQLLVSSITLRRLKDKIELPERAEMKHRLDFSEEEQALYTAFVRQTRSQVRELTKKGQSSGRSYSNILKFIGRLRLIAAHGHELLSEEDMESLEDHSQGNGLTISDLGEEPDPTKEDKFITEGQAYAELDRLQESETALCLLCSRQIGRKEPEIIDLDSDSEEAESSGSEGDEYNDVMGYLTPCLHLICTQCEPKKDEYQPNKSADGFYTCPECEKYERAGLFELRRSIQKKLLALQAEASHNRHTKWDSSTYSGPSTKVRALLEDLRKSAAESAALPEDEPPIRSVVFSGWTSYLDLIQFALEKENIGYERLDGAMSIKQRTAALTKFKTDPSIVVLLVSIKAGGQGLNFTAASKAYVMEPQFNPGVEQQAVDRIHRMGQTRPVTIVHYLMRGSIEEAIEKLQEKKESLAQMSLDRKKSGPEAAKARMAAIRDLFK